MIRITGGKYRSRLLTTPSGILTKPTMDKVRAAVFSALSNDKLDNVLDLFAGSGLYGFESLSRGAKHVYFVDKSRDAINAIKENALKLGADNIDICQNDALSFLRDCAEQFDVIFVDPPYKLDVYEDITKLILEKNLLTDNGILVLESEKELNINVEQFSKTKYYKYGLAKIYILRK